MLKTRTAIPVIIVLIILIASGCGVGGGSGRFSLPGEIPTIPGVEPDPTDPGETDPDALLASAWEDFRFGAYSSAISKFNQVLTLTSATQNHKVLAYNGLGWSQTRFSGVESGYFAFIRAASSNNEAKIGLAAALMQRGRNTEITQAIKLLEEIGLSNTAYRFQSSNPIGVSNAEARAMLAFCYFWRGNTGDNEKARVQIGVARSEDSSGDSSVAHIYRSLKELGLDGI